MRTWTLALLCLALSACDVVTALPAAPAPTVIADAGANDDASMAVIEIVEVTEPTCEARIAELALDAPSARHDAYAAQLPEVLVRAPIDPVLFLQWPDARPRTALDAAVRTELEASRRPARDVRHFLATHRGRASRRDVLLSDGYFFADHAALAVALSAVVQLDDLFDAPRIYRARDGVIDVLDRTEGGYVEADGSMARLRLNDRVADDVRTLASPLGLDLEVLREESGALRTIPTAIGGNAAALDLVFPDASRRPSLVVLHEGRTELACIGGSTETLEITRAHAARFWARHRALVSSAEALVAESPRFDEPTDEPEGVQEDGQLRGAWMQAYLAGERTFTYGTVAYPVFDRVGRPIPPEVCIDFVFDAWERGGGAWFRSLGDAPGRTSGSLDLHGSIPRRNLTSLLEHTATEGSILARYDVPSEDRVALAEGADYAHAVAREVDAFREGDALVVYGLRQQDMRRHHHALLVIRTEPMTGIPMVVGDNQGRPQFRTLANAMQAAPLRSIDHRLRLVDDSSASL